MLTAASIFLTLAATLAGDPSAFDTAVTRDRVVLAGQPSEADLESLDAREIEHVVNLRPAAEMAAIGFDEKAKLEALGVDYVEIPIGGAEHPYGPAALDAFRRVMEESDGKVLLHCASGGRSAQLYAAYRVKYLGASPDEALRDVQGAWPLPLEVMTGIPLRVERAEPAANDAGEKRQPQ